MKPKEIKDIRKILDKTQTELGQILGVSLRAVQSWESGMRNISKSSQILLQNILNEELRRRDIVLKEPHSFYVGKMSKLKIFVKYVSVMDHEFYLKNIDNNTSYDSLEETGFMFDSIEKVKYLCFEAEDQGMDGGGIHDTPAGADLLCEELPEIKWRKGFEHSKYGWVIVHKDTILFRDIEKYNPSTDEILCSSRSKLPQYRKFPLSLNEIREIFKVVKRAF